jgi:hypothetical protein
MTEDLSFERRYVERSELDRLLRRLVPLRERYQADSGTNGDYG